MWSGYSSSVNNLQFIAMPNNSLFIFLGVFVCVGLYTFDCTCAEARSPHRGKLGSAPGPLSPPHTDGSRSSASQSIILSLLQDSLATLLYNVGVLY